MEIPKMRLDDNSTTNKKSVAAGFSLRKERYLTRNLKVAATIYHVSMNVSLGDAELRPYIFTILFL